ncbi:hypothetical protein [Melittangium boletus]|uniref:hypothetical protein n=1 Tax=Melittangium boletus TaxID=83453 RepID=UPI003DA50704
MLRVLLEDTTLRRGYLRVACFQVVAILLLVGVFSDAGRELGRMTGATQRVEAHLEEAQEDAEADALAHSAASLAALLQKKDADPEEVAELREEIAALKAEVQKARAGAEKTSERPRDGWAWTLVNWAGLLTSLYVCQWVVIALSRDHHSHLSREVSLRTGLEPEDEAVAPRIRLNPPWMIKKLKQRWRAVWLFSLGMPVLYVVKLAIPSSARWVLFPVLVSLWGAWWFVVFTAGKSARAWDEPEARAPWFLRGWNRMFSAVPGLRGYGAFWSRATTSVFSPAAQVERSPWGLSGLALARGLSGLPLVKCFLRPVIPVAAAHLLRAERDGVPASAPAPLAVPRPG